MRLSIASPPSTTKIGQTELSDLEKATVLGEGKIWIHIRRSVCQEYRWHIIIYAAYKGSYFYTSFPHYEF